MSATEGGTRRGNVHHFGTSRRKGPSGRVFTFKTLHEKGIDYHPNHIRRLVLAGRFPAPFYLSDRRPAWLEDALDAWIDSKLAELEVA